MPTIFTTSILNIIIRARFAKKLLFPVLLAIIFLFSVFSRAIVARRMFGKSHKSLLFDLCFAVFLESISAPFSIPQTIRS